jgi:hypothetical protein
MLIWNLVKQITDIIMKTKNIIAVAETMLTVGWFTMNYFSQTTELPCPSK